MILMKKLSSKQVLEVISKIAMEDIPEGLHGELHLRYDDEDGIEIFFLEKNENHSNHVS